MRRLTPTSLQDRHQALLSARDEAESEAARLTREEQYLAGQIRQATEQVRYYEGLLTLLRRDVRKAPGIVDIVRRLQ